MVLFVIGTIRAYLNGVWGLDSIMIQYGRKMSSFVGNTHSSVQRRRGVRLATNPSGSFRLGVGMGVGVRVEFFCVVVSMFSFLFLHFKPTMGRVHSMYGRGGLFRKVDGEGHSERRHLSWDVQEKELPHKNPRGRDNNYDIGFITKHHHHLYSAECKAMV